MALPQIKLSTTNIIYGAPENGSLVYRYAPFNNLKKLNTLTGTTDLFPLTLSSENAGINIDI